MFGWIVVHLDKRPIDESAGPPVQGSPAAERPAEPQLDDASLPALPENSRAALNNSNDILPSGPRSFFDRLTSSAGQDFFEAEDRKLGEGAGISWHCRPPKAVFRPTAYERFFKPFILQGRQDVTTLMYFGGLSGTGYSWRDLAVKLFERSGFQSEVYSMAGHTGCWKDFRDTTEREWIKDMEQKVLACPAPPVMFCYSTSLPVAIEVERRNPGAIKAIIGIGGPFILQDSLRERQMDLGRRLNGIFRVLKLDKLSPFKFASVPTGEEYGPHSTKLEKKSPSFHRLPLPTAFSLRRLQLLGRRAAKQVHVPIFYAQGRSDPIVSAKVPNYVHAKYTADLKQVKIYEKSAHGLHMGRERYKFLGDISEFLCRVFAEEPQLPGIPDFKARIVQLSPELFKTESGKERAEGRSSY